MFGQNPQLAPEQPSRLPIAHTAHFLHEACAVSFWNLPGGQASHRLWFWNMPNGQSLQKTRPVLGWYLPTGHSLHPRWLVSV
jgi:hypothetical protein